MMEPDKNASTGSKQETQHNLVTAFGSKIGQLHSLMQNDDLEGTIHQVVEKLQKDSEAESEAERKHMDLHIAVEDLKAKLAEKGKQLKDYELALMSTAQQLEELALISETRLRNAAEHGSRGLMITTEDGIKCESCGLQAEGCQPQKTLQELEDAQHQLAMTNNILVQGQSARDRFIAEVKGTVKQCENLVSLEQAKSLSISQEELKCKACGLGKLEFKLLDDARHQLAVTNDTLALGLNDRDKHIRELEEMVRRRGIEAQEAQACLQETNTLIGARDSQIQRLEMELLCSAAGAASMLMPEQKETSLSCSGQNGLNPATCAGQAQEQKPLNSVCPMRRLMESSPIISGTMQHIYDQAKEAFHSTSLEGGGASGKCPMQAALARMSACARAQEEAARSLHGTRGQEPTSNHNEFYAHTDPPATYKLQHTDSSSARDASLPCSTVLELRTQQTSGWKPDFPQSFHSSSICAIATTGASSPPQDLPSLAYVAATYHPQPPNRPY
ncbi:unnamed protein product [Sphagnum balticum]